MEATTIRQARLEDSDQLAALEARATTYCWTPGQYRESIGVHSSWVLDVGDLVAGCVIFNRVMDEVELLNIVVDPAFQGRGLGRRLLNFLMDTNRSLAEKIFLEVRVSNNAAIALYQHAGFTVLGKRKNYYPAQDGREDALIMAYNYAK